MADSISLADKLATFQDYWSPRTITTFNDCDVMVVKVKGEFTWHKHDDTDDFFLVLKGQLDIELRDRTVTLGPGDSTSCAGVSSIARWPARRFISC
jgi:mannose-6-phosphate isomerase-like protein (cupin superfamily)